MTLNSSIQEIKGIGEKTGKSFQNIGVFTIRDLLLYYPGKYKKFEEPVMLPRLAEKLEKQEEELFSGDCAVKLTIQNPPVVQNGGRMPVSVYKHHEAGHALECIWFRMPYLRSTLRAGETFVFHGKVTLKRSAWHMEQPTIYTVEKYAKRAGKYMPVYSLARGLTQNLLQKTIASCLECLDLEPEYLPKEIRSRNELSEYNYAVRQIHFPDSKEHIKQAMQRLAFDEFFLFLLTMKRTRTHAAELENEYPVTDTGTAKSVIGSLPYELTDAQILAFQEIMADMCSPYAMQRLIQGDVGSGKTIVAFLSMLEVAKNGYQAALMAPTEVLAHQHYENFMQMKEDYGLDWLRIIYLSGSMSKREKRNAYEKMLLFGNAIVVGTHALIQEQAVYQNLGLVVTDEQHRFGVRQRETFTKKGGTPHILVMSATPIPRTLAIIMYGDLDITLIKDLPAKRLPVKNCVIDESYRTKTYNFLEKEIAAGHQCYIVCSLVEKSENLEIENVTEYSERLQAHFGDRVVVEMLHGRMKPALKNDIMERFSKNEIQVLVSTTVIEVGINVPNATVMMVENAERFGLAQLHQLRGRVGRGEAQSYCILINGSDSSTSKNRLEILKKSNDGFFIAEEDLKMRGPGDFFGIRQSGEFQFGIADIYRDSELLKAASSEVSRLLLEDPALEREEHAPLKKKLAEYYEEFTDHINL